jgi:hypothetical protein
MKRRWRFVATAMKNESQKLLWFGAMITGPSCGMRSAPVMRRPKYSRMNTTIAALTTA